MHVVSTEKELYATIEKLKKKVWFRVNPNSDATPRISKALNLEDKEVKYTVMGYHDTILYKGKAWHIKFPSLYGESVRKIRCIEEKLFNEEFVVWDDTQSAIEREIQTYKSLNEKDFPTLKTIDENFADVKGVLITQRISNPIHTIDLIKECASRAQREYVVKIIKLMKQLHDKNMIWGDAWLGNSLYIYDKPIIYDFGLKPNPSKSQAFLKGKDIISLVTSAVYRTKQPAETIVPVMLEAYDPSLEIIDGINHSLYHMKKDYMNRLSLSTMNFMEEQFYFKPVYGLNRKEVEKIREAIYKNI
jgi:tRNA A-37 threonylcarbamoyl transferase component Bud32